MWLFLPFLVLPKLTKFTWRRSWYSKFVISDGLIFVAGWAIQLYEDELSEPLSENHIHQDDNRGV